MPPEASSPGSIEAAPGVARFYFNNQLNIAQQYASHLATTGVSWGLLGPRELPRLWTRHILNCVVLSELIDARDTVADLGSGAGLPGLVLAIARPDVSVTLIEPLERRVEWLTMVSDELALGNVRVIRARAEELIDREMFSVVTSRAVKALSGLATWTAPLLVPGGRMLAIKGRSVDEEVSKAQKSLRKARLEPTQVHVLGEGQLSEPTRVFEAVRR